MDIHIVLVSIGSGLTTAILVAALVSYILEPVIEFSVFVGIPAGVIAGVLAFVGATYLLARDPTPLLIAVFSAIATFGYVLIGLYAVRVIIPITRQTIRPDWILLIAIITAVVVLGVQFIRRTKMRNPAIVAEF